MISYNVLVPMEFALKFSSKVNCSKQRGPPPKVITAMAAKSVLCFKCAVNVHNEYSVSK